MTGWLLSPAPLARVAVLRVVVYLFVPVDVLLTTTWVRAHASVPGELYVPLRIGRLLPLPTPGPWVEVFQVLLVVAALVAAAAAVRGVLPRLTGWLVALMYLEWMVVAMSYGKVDHDRFAFLVALFVLPSVGRAGLRSRERSEAAGWALTVIALAVVATYTLAAVAKIRFGGWDWVDGATLTRAVLRRSTPLSEPLLEVPVVLHAAQYGLMVLELVVAPLLLVRWRDPRIGWLLALAFLGFHVMTFAMITIIFLPHCIALLALLPLERLTLRKEPVPA
ncbi:MAG: HTTM domain-containing protein [Candidatus Limnocylindrales bacterium]